MRCHAPKLALVMLCGIAALAGCAPQQPLYLRNSDDFSHYLGMSQTIDNADVPSDHAHWSQFRMARHLLGMFNCHQTRQ